ncbi:MAG: ATP-dependent helicase HrpB [Pseudomonadota bacterium]
MSDAPLPIQAVLPAILSALGAANRVVLQAPPGAGKTTCVPLEMLRADAFADTLVMLEPRRLAARAAAERMAATLGEQVGQRVGYRVRGESRISAQTRIEVVTEGILTRRIQSDPGLSGVGAVIFDEFHERSLHADLGLALCLEAADALREDLKIVVMSATLDAAPVADLMQAPIVTSAGRTHPVDIRFLDRPLRTDTRFDTALADLTIQAAQQTSGGLLVFAPGEGEIRRVAARLADRLPDECVVQPLYGALPFARQKAAISPLRTGRKVVLATAIAETSLTIEDIRVVVDGGRARRSVFDPSSGMSRLVTEPVTRAEADQRAGRAGRVARGTAYRLWTKGEDGARQPHAPPEILRADLAGLALDLALWGAAPGDVPLLTPPNPGAFAEACELLEMLGALDANGRITDHGRRLVSLPLHPRLAHMLDVAGSEAAVLAALLAERDPMPRGTPVDLGLRLAALKGGAAHPVPRAVRERVTAEAKRLRAQIGPARNQRLSEAQCAVLAYPDRIGLRRKGGPARFVLSGGKGAVLPDDDPLAGARLLVATDLDGDPREARIRQAAPVSESEIRAIMDDRIQWCATCEWDRRTKRISARQEERLGAVILESRNWKEAPPEAMARAMLDGVRDLGLNWNDASRRFAARVRVVRTSARDLPDMSESALLDGLEDWLLPYIDGVRTAADWRGFDMLPALRARLDWPQMQQLDREAPARFTTPLGREVPIDYTGTYPEIALRLQEMFGQTTHPVVAGQPLRVTLLSPAGRPLQTTMDLPGFWASSYADVRKDMRGRYPKHPWPEDPTRAEPTRRTKRRS